jgi:hypothetical protein
MDPEIDLEPFSREFYKLQSPTRSGAAWNSSIAGSSSKLFEI